MAILDLERWHLASPYLDRALDLDEAGRQELLERLRRSDPALAEDLRSLLESHRSMLERSFLEGSPGGLPDFQAVAGQAIGPYELVGPIGYGGMGTVWLAERRDGRFDRQVAIKLLNVGLVGLPASKRFLREGALLAQLRHPNIAELIDAGLLAGGRPYLVLEHVDGDPIDTHCDAAKLDIDERVRLLLQVAAAVQHAHTHLVVHRDLKPANVLVTKDGTVKLLDFGIAKLLGDGADGASPGATLTREGGVALTPEYAAPEQLAGLPVSTATDVYALGVMLYVLLAGRHPAGRAMSTPGGLVRAVLETTPESVSNAAASRPDDDTSAPETTAEIASRRRTTVDGLQRTLRGDLDTIVAKALKKEPSERYASVSALADDLRRYLEHQPISARPDTVGYRARKFIRRHRGGVAASLLALVAVAGGVAATVVQADIARRQRDFALLQLARAEALNELNNFLLVDAAPGGKPFTVVTLLEQAEEIVGRQRGDDSGRSNVLVSIGGQYAALEAVDDARRVLEKAYAASLHSPEPAVRANAACSLAEALVLAGESDRARALAQEGLRALPDENEYALDRASCLLKASRVEREAGSTDRAIELALEAKSVRARAPYRSNLLDLRLDVDLAEAYSQAGRFNEANQSFARASDALSVIGRDATTMAGTLYNNWALSLSQLGRPLQAEPLFRRAIEISRDDAASNAAVAPMLLLNYARTLREIGRHEEAAALADEAYAKAQATGHAVVVNQSLMVRAATYREQGRLDRAAAALDEVEPRLHEALPPGHYAFAALAMERAQQLAATGRLEQAQRVIDEGVAIAEADRAATGRTSAVPRLLVRRAEILEARGEHRAAITDASDALGVLQSDAPPTLRTSLIGQALLIRGQSRLALGENAAGRADLVAAVAHLEDSLGPGHSLSRKARSLAGAPPGS